MTRHTLLTLIILGLAGVFLGGCYSTPVPMPVRVYEAPTAERPKTLVVMLHGMGGDASYFERLGFIAQAREAGLGADIWAPEANYGYYRQRIFERRLKEDVIEPAKAKGYTRIWLVGLSLGGVGSVFYTHFYPHDLAGVVLLSPFLGYDDIVDEVTSYGGARRWTPQEPADMEHWRTLLWAWLKEYDQRRDELAPLYLAYGRRDPYMRGQSLLAQLLPDDRLFITEGQHSFPTFKRLWGMVLATVPFDPARAPDPQP